MKYFDKLIEIHHRNVEVPYRNIMFLCESTMFSKGNDMFYAERSLTQ